eukprot:symbB.v1.2.034417.t1/scaffold4402.1/size45815/2
MRLLGILLILLGVVSCQGHLQDDATVLLQRTTGATGLKELSPEELLAEDEDSEEFGDEVFEGVSPCVAARTCLE